MADELPVGEDVAAGAGDDREGALASVCDAEDDVDPGAGADAAVVIDGAVVGARGGVDAMVGWPGLGGGGPGVAWCASTGAAVGALVVVGDAEHVELGLELAEGAGVGLFREPAFQGLV